MYNMLQWYHQAWVWLRLIQIKYKYIVFIISEVKNIFFNMPNSADSLLCFQKINDSSNLLTPGIRQDLSLEKFK